jgi:Helix-loop-helix DNA-binding domain
MSPSRVMPAPYHAPYGSSAAAPGGPPLPAFSELALARPAPPSAGAGTTPAGRPSSPSRTTTTTTATTTTTTATTATMAMAMAAMTPPRAAPTRSPHGRTKKLLHREVEQARRSRMAAQIDLLRAQLAPGAAAKADKVSVLQAAVSHIAGSAARFAALEKDRDAARAEADRLRAALHAASGAGTTAQTANAIQQVAARPDSPDSAAAPDVAAPSPAPTVAATGRLGSTIIHQSNGNDTRMVDFSQHQEYIAGTYPQQISFPSSEPPDSAARRHPLRPTPLSHSDEYRRVASSTHGYSTLSPRKPPFPAASSKSTLRQLPLRPMFFVSPQAEKDNHGTGIGPGLPAGSNHSSSYGREKLRHAPLPPPRQSYQQDSYYPSSSPFERESQLQQQQQELYGTTQEVSHQSSPQGEQQGQGEHLALPLQQQPADMQYHSSGSGYRFKQLPSRGSTWS